jgi:uncharacterized protein (TIRG00374 family)
VSIVSNEPATAEVAPSSEVGLGRRVLSARTIGSLVVGLAILAFGLSRLNVNVGETLQTMGTANWRLMLLALVVYYTVFPVRALRWRRMLRNAGTDPQTTPGVPRLAEIIYLSWFANSVVPAKLGDVYRAYLLRQQSRISFSKAGGTIVAERVIDLVALLLILATTGLLSFQGRLPGPVRSVLIASLIAVVVALVAVVSMHRLDAIVRRLIPGRFQGYYAHFHEGVLGSFGGYPTLVGLTLLAWAGEGARLFLVTRAVGLTLSPNLGLDLLMVMFIALGTALLTAPPGTPAGLGYVEASMAYVLVLLGAHQSVALSVALLDRSISFLSLIVGGIIVYVISQRHN